LSWFNEFHGKVTICLNECIVNTMSSFIFVGHWRFVGNAIHEFKIQAKYFFHFSNITFNLKGTHSSVYEHVQCRQTMKFRAHEIKWIHSTRVYGLITWVVLIVDYLQSEAPNVHERFTDVAPCASFGLYDVENVHNITW